MVQGASGLSELYQRQREIMQFVPTKKGDQKLIEVLTLYQGLFYKFAWILLSLHLMKGAAGAREFRERLDAYRNVLENDLKSKRKE